MEIKTSPFFGVLYLLFVLIVTAVDVLGIIEELRSEFFVSLCLSLGMCGDFLNSSVHAIAF